MSVTECKKFSTTDEQLNYNLEELVKLIIESFQDGTLITKNSERLQNLTIDDIIDLAIKKMPNTNLTSYITTNGTTIIEMIDSYDIVRDTKFVNSDYLNFKVIQRREPDPNDKTGLTMIDVPYIQAKLPYDLINKDRIVQIYITTKDQSIKLSDKNIGNEVIFEYFLDVDPTDIRAPYLFETRALNLNLGELRIINIDTNPANPELWGTWSKERFIVVSYLVDYTTWFGKPITGLPDPTENRISRITNSESIPMTWNGSGINNKTDKPNEVVNIINTSTKIAEIINNAPIQLEENITFKRLTNEWIVVEDPAKSFQFFEYIRWLSEANKIIFQNKSNFTWKPDGVLTETAKILIPPNKIISQLTYNLTKIQFEKFGKDIGKDGLASKIIELIESKPIKIFTTDKIPNYNSIVETDNRVSLMLKFEQGEQFPFIDLKVIKVPSWVIQVLTGHFNFTTTNKLISDASKIILKTGTIPFDLLETIKPEFKSANIIEFESTEARNIALKLFLTYFPSRIVNQLLNSLNSIQYLNGKLFYFPSRIINFLTSIPTTYNEPVKFNFTGSKIIEEIDTNPALKSQNSLFTKTGSKIIEKMKSGPFSRPQKEIFNKTGSKIIEASLITTMDFLKLPSIYQKHFSRIVNQNKIENPLDIWTKLQKRWFNNILVDYDYSKLIIYDPARIINQETVAPVQMEINSGTLNYIKDMYNLRVVSSLNKEEFVALITSDGKQQRSEYEFIADQDQRVFYIEHNPELVSIFRQGFKLSHGDYYTDGIKIILKSPANAGEIINIISERKYVFSNTVTKEELNNALNRLKTERPILTYPVSTYEKNTIEIKIENYDITSIYNVAIKFEGKYRDDLVWNRNNDIIVIEVPEIDQVAIRTLNVVVTAHIDGKLKSLPTEAQIQIKNIFDFGDIFYKLIFGATPTEWVGTTFTKYSFDEKKSPKSEYSNLTPLTTPIVVPNRIGIQKDKWYQNEFVNIANFKGTYIDGVIGLENLPTRSLKIIETNGVETIISSNRSQSEIEEAFNKGNLYVIVDNSNDPNKILINGLKYNYEPLINYTPNLNLLPRTEKTADKDATWYLEHINRLVGKNIHALMFLDIEFSLDFDFTGRSKIDEDNTLSVRNQSFKSIKYKVQNQVPYLFLEIDDPEIIDANNQYFNIGSTYILPTGNSIFNNIQKDEKLLINNQYAEKYFGKNISDLKIKDPKIDNSKLLFKDVKYYKINNIFSSMPTVNPYDNIINKDVFMLNENEFALNKTIKIGMSRYTSDNLGMFQTLSFSQRTKEIGSSVDLKDSFKSLMKMQSKLLNVGSDYQSNFGLIKYGGLVDYVDSSNNVYPTIERQISHERIYIKNSSDPRNLISGKTLPDISDFDSKVSTPNLIRIPSIWDVVLRPSSISSLQPQIEELWSLFKTPKPETDPLYTRYTEGILKASKVIEDPNIVDNLLRTSYVVPIENQSGLILFGGQGYKTKVFTQFAGNLIDSNSFTNLNINPNFGWVLPELVSAFNKIDIAYIPGNPSSGWKNRNDIIKTRFGWENNQPYIDIAWGEWYEWRELIGDSDIYTPIYTYHNAMKFFWKRLTREEIFNKNIYHLNLNNIENYNPNEDEIFPTFITRLTNLDYEKMFDTTVGVTPYTQDLTTPDDKAINFQDIVYSEYSNSWWLTVKKPYTNETFLYKFVFAFTAGSAGTGITLSSLNFQLIDNLSITDPNFSKWSLLTQRFNSLDGDGPLLIKHNEQNPTINTPTIKPGIYHYNALMNIIELKSELSKVQTSAIVYPIMEAYGLRKEVIVGIDPKNEDIYEIETSGTKIFIVTYLDKFISKLSKDEFKLFKEEILNIDANASFGNKNKIIEILPNTQKIAIKAILPDGDDYKSTSAQILLRRTATESGMQASSIVFRLKNLDKDILEVDHVRFQTS